MKTLKKYSQTKEIHNHPKLPIFQITPPPKFVLTREFRFQVMKFKQLPGWVGPGLRSMSLESSERRVRNQREMKSRERHHVHRQFAQISVQLTRESKTGSDTRHGSRNQMVEITISGSSQFQSSETNIIQSFVINTISFVLQIYSQKLIGNRTWCV